MLMDAVDKPERSLQSVASSFQSEAVKWELPGKIRSAVWCIMFLVSEAIGFEAHHERVPLLAGVSASAWGTFERLQLMLMLRATVFIAQLDPATNMFVETLFRRARIIEYAWSERSYNRKAKDDIGGKLFLEAQMMSGGLIRSAAAVMYGVERVSACCGRA